MEVRSLWFTVSTALPSQLLVQRGSVHFELWWPVAVPGKCVRFEPCLSDFGSQEQNGGGLYGCKLRISGLLSSHS